MGCYNIHVKFIEIKEGSTCMPVTDAWNEYFLMSSRVRDKKCLSLGQTCITLYNIELHLILVGCDC